MAVPEGYVRVDGSERQPAREAKLVRPAVGSESMSVTVHVRRRADAPQLPDLDYWARTPLDQREFVSREQFAGRYGAAEDDLDQVAAFVESHGLTVTESSVERRSVVVSGTVAQMSTAFGVSLGHYESPTETYRGREGFIHVPQQVEEIVESVLGLDNRRVAKPGVASTVGDVASPDASPPGGASALTPVQVAGLYNFPTASASGQTIGIIELGGGYALQDIQAFFTGLGLPTPPLTDVSVDGATNAPAGSLSNVTVNNPDIEVALDIDVAGAAAPGAAIAMYFAPNTQQGFADAIKTAVLDQVNAPTVLSISWSGSEDASTPAARKTMAAALVEAAALGVTVLVDSGDWGSDAKVGNGQAHVMYPSSEPGVIACGGTYIANVAGFSFTEGTWNDVGATGGGISDVIALPSWQKAAGIPGSANPGNASGRGVPDVAGNASPFSGYTLTLYGQPTTKLTITSGLGTGGPYGTVAGTSAVPPLYAGLLAVIIAQLGRPLGFLNSVLYGLAGTTVFRDINDGVNNQWVGETQAAPFYTSGAGWDACTGLGRIDGNVLLSELGSFGRPTESAVSVGRPTALTTKRGETSLYVMGLPGAADGAGSHGSQVWSRALLDQRPGQVWGGWFSLGPNVFSAKETVTAISPEAGQTSLYVMGLPGAADGAGSHGSQVWSRWFPDPQRPGEWGDWFSLGPNVFSAGETVTAVSPAPGQTQLYVMGLPGAADGAGSHGSQVWSRWFPDPQRPGEWGDWFSLGPNVF